MPPIAYGEQPTRLTLPSGKGVRWWVSQRVSIGEFARLTYLSVKTLRYYHEVALLEPVAVDAGSGYRRCSVDQVAQAHLIFDIAAG